MLTAKQEQTLREAARKTADAYFKPEERAKSRPDPADRKASAAASQAFVSDVINVTAYILFSEAEISGGVKKADAFKSLARMVGIDEAKLRKAIKPWDG